MKCFAGLCGKYGAEYEENAVLAPYTTFKIGGKCDLLIKINSAEFLADVLRLCRLENVPYYILGRGSNVLISGRGLGGAVLLTTGLNRVTRNDTVLTCGCGASLGSAAREAMRSGLTGFEFVCGIPGTIGGGVYMNAGAYGRELKDVVQSVRCIDVNDFSVKTLRNEELDFSYRHSVFTENQGIITEVRIELERGVRADIKNDMDELMRKRAKSQPVEFPSGGSTFKRPAGDYAARLIDVCGLKGFSVGGAEVSTKHSGFIVNKGGASFEDVTELIAAVKRRVFEHSGINLECEIKILE